jgi:hypothetical protein
MSGAERIAAERERQVSAEGWTAEHDDQHDRGELRGAAACYLIVGLGAAWEAVPAVWPFEPASYKLGSDIDNLVKAGALIAAEIDRLERAHVA